MLVFDTLLNGFKKRPRMFSHQSWTSSPKNAGTEAMIMCGTTVLSQRIDRRVRLKERLAAIGRMSCKDQAPEKKLEKRSESDRASSEISIDQKRSVSL